MKKLIILLFTLSICATMGFQAQTINFNEGEKAFNSDVHKRKIGKFDNIQKQKKTADHPLTHRRSSG